VKSPVASGHPAILVREASTAPPTQSSVSPPLAVVASCVAGITFIALVLSLWMTSAASAATLSLTPQFSSTQLGQGTTLTATLALSGTEQNGFVDSANEVKLDLPAGTEFTPEGFGTCEASTFSKIGPNGCPPNSLAGEAGAITMNIPIWNQIFSVSGDLWSAFAPGGGLTFYASISPLTQSTLEVETPLPGSLIGNHLAFSIPTLRSLPGEEPPLAVTALTLHFGAVRTERGTSIYSLRMPEECPEGGFVWRAEASFFGGSAAHTVANTPCPPEGPQSLLSGTRGVIEAPTGDSCPSNGGFSIHIHQVDGLRYRRATVKVNGREVAVASGKQVSAPITLRRLPTKFYTVKVTVLTNTGRRITGTRSYHPCAAKTPQAQ
jgi:hypothetical protein